MSTELPAPSGLFFCGHFIPMDQKTIEIFIGLQSCFDAERHLYEEFVKARDADEPDLMSYAVDYRNAVLKGERTITLLVEHMRGPQ